MQNLLYKEFKVSISPLFFLVPILSGALMLIPGWLYFIVLLYFAFISLPNIFAAYKTQNDLIFSFLLPVKRQEIVKARITTILILELMQILFAVFFTIIHNMIYKNPFYFFMKPNLAFFGLAFIMFGLINIGFFPLYFRSAYKYGVPTIVANAVGILFAAGAELLNLFNTPLHSVFHNIDGAYWSYQWIILAGGIVLFALLSLLSYSLSIKEFEKVDAS